MGREFTCRGMRTEGCEIKSAVKRVTLRYGLQVGTTENVSRKTSREEISERRMDDNIKMYLDHEFFHKTGNFLVKLK
jgi:hypothetical protein